MSAVNKDTIRKLIPHAGSMCLIDRVLDYDDRQIRCETATHRDSNNPLRCEDSLGAVNLIEYAAQCMAIHGGLLAQQNGEGIGQGYLVAVRNVQLHIATIDQLDNCIHIVATQMLSNAGSMMYTFSVTHNDSLLAQGRVTVMRQF